MCEDLGCLKVLQILVTSDHVIGSAEPYGNVAIVWKLQKLQVALCCEHHKICDMQTH